jgi:hypothetical protein
MAAAVAESAATHRARPHRSQRRAARQGAPALDRGGGDQGLQRADALKAAHTFKSEMDAEAARAMFPRNERPKA